MNTICDKCGGKIKYNRVLKEETVRVEKSSGCCLISILLTICTCGLNLLFSYLTSFKKTNRCVIRGTCQKCGKVYEFDSYPDEDEVENIHGDSGRQYSLNGLCETCKYAEEYMHEDGWCDKMGDYVSVDICDAYEEMEE